MEPTPPASRRRAAARVATLMVALATAVAAASCRAAVNPEPRPPTPAEVARGEWPRELALAQAAAARQEYALADSVLRGFAARFPGTAEAADAAFWRALFRLDPAAPREQERDPVREATAALDAYLAGGPVLPRYTEASTLRRLAGLLDSLRTAAGAGATRALPSPTGLRDSVKARDDEIARLQKELQETTAELERIRRRLAPRRP